MACHSLEPQAQELEEGEPLLLLLLHHTQNIPEIESDRERKGKWFKGLIIDSETKSLLFLNQDVGQSKDHHEITLHGITETVKISVDILPWKTFGV